MNTVDIDKLREHVELVQDGTLRWKIPKQGRSLGGQAFTTRAGPGKKYLRGMFQGVMLSAHRVVWALTYDQWPDGWIDHIDGDTTNNRPENLRIADPKLSNHNRRYGRCPYVGVYFFKNGYVAQIQRDGTHEYLGRFKTAEEAAKVRDARAKELYGKDALLNFP